MKTESGVVVSIRAGDIDYGTRIGLTLVIGAGTRGALWLGCEMSPDEARVLATELIAEANRAEGGKA